MSEIKLNTWTWGVVPELHPEAVVIPGGTCEKNLHCFTVPFRYCDLDNRERKRWYRILSLGPPEMPEEELRLPVGWSVGTDEQKLSCWMLSAERKVSYSKVCARIHVFEETRAECVREINRLLEGK